MSTINVRASSFGTIFDCAYRFEGEQLLKITKRNSLRAWLGSSIHASTAAFDQAKLDGAPISADDAAGAFVDMFYDAYAEVELDPKLTMRQGEIIGLTLHSRYCAEIAPTMTYESVEKPLEPLKIDCGGGLILRLTGTLDRARVVRTHHGKVIGDVKTGGRLITDGVVSIKGRGAQLGTYQILSEHTDGEEVGGAQIIALQTTSTTQVGISKVFDARPLMLGTDENPGLIEMAAKMFKIGLFPPNPQSVLCDKKYCARWGTCKYHD
jgi:hypothetical protein